MPLSIPIFPSIWVTPEKRPSREDEIWQDDVITSSHIDTTQSEPQSISHNDAVHDEACQLWILFFPTRNLDNPINKWRGGLLRVALLSKAVGHSPRCIHFWSFDSDKGITGVSGCIADRRFFFLLLFLETWGMTSNLRLLFHSRTDGLLIFLFDSSLISFAMLAFQPGSRRQQREWRHFDDSAIARRTRLKEGH